MSLSEFSIRRPVFAWMLMIGLIFFGALCFTRMGISQLPDVDFPVVSISLSYEGASPEVIETDVVDVIEDAVMSVQGIKSVTSYSRYGSASISLEFDLDKDIDTALQEVQTKVAQAQRNLPREVDAPSFNKTNPEDQPIMWLTVSSSKISKQELMVYVRDQIKDKFSTIAGVGEVMLGGYVEPNLRVWISNKQLNQFELTVGDVLDTITNEHSELPAGQIETQSKEFDVRTMGEAKNISEFQNIVINQRGGRPNYNLLKLNDIAKIEEGLEDIRRISRFNGIPAIGLGIKKQRGTNAVEIAERIHQKVASLQSSLPETIQLGVNFDTTTFIKESVDELNFTLILSAILTSFVCWFFLGSISSTINILFAIPTSIIGAFIALYFLGFTLNTFTLLGLSLAVGIVVDDAIMVLENIVRHRQLGKSKIKAAIEGANEISFAALAATVAIIAVFIPVAFMRGAIGEFFLQFGVTMTVTVILSLIEALTLTPMRCSQFLQDQHSQGRFEKHLTDHFEKLSLIYKKTLQYVLNYRWTVVLGSLVFFAASIFSLTALKKEFIPSQDQGRFLVRLQTPIDSSIQFTDQKFKQAEEILSQIPSIDRVYSAVGGFRGGDVNSGNLFISLKEKKMREINKETSDPYTQQELMSLVRKQLSQISDTKVFIQDLSMRGFSASRGFPVEFSIRGKDWDSLAQTTQEMMQKMNESGLMTDIDTDYKQGKSEIRIIPDRAKAAQYGVSIRAISETVRATIGGVRAGKYAMGGHRYDIRIRLSADERNQSEQIKNLFVRNNRGERVRLSDVVKIEERPSLQQISRYDRERAITVSANVKPGVSQQSAIDFVKKLGNEIKNSGNHVVLGGSSQGFAESFNDLLMALILGLVVAYMVLAAQFNSFIDPISVLIALPFSLSGAFIALWLGDLSLNIYSFIGIILLMGIAKKNSILLVEFTNQTLTKGSSITESLLYACPVRLRPIIMTSFATIAGAIPPALSIGPGAETRVPMAATVIGGILVSTILTLYVVPCVYSLLSQLPFRQLDNTNAISE